MKLILDTSFLIELKKGNKKAIEVLENRKEQCEDLIVSGMTVYELLVGANYLWKKHGNTREMITVDEMLKTLTVVAVDSEVVRKAAEVKAELMLRGLDVPDLNVLITCTDEGEILTFDTDFAPLRELGFKVILPDNSE